MACRRRINGATRSGLRLVMQRLIPTPSLGLFLRQGAFRGQPTVLTSVAVRKHFYPIPVVLKLITPAKTNKNTRLFSFNVEVRALMHDDGGIEAVFEPTAWQSDPIAFAPRAKHCYFRCKVRCTGSNAMANKTSPFDHDTIDPAPQFYSYIGCLDSRGGRDGIHSGSREICRKMRGDGAVIGTGR
jgi:hypothetical protein